MENKKITIGIFVDSYFPMIDGVVMVVHNYAKRLADKANVIVFAPRFGKPFDDSKFAFKVVRSKSFQIPFIDYRAPLPKMDKQFQKELKESNLDIVHIHSGFAIGNQGAEYAREHNIPVIATLHSQHKRDILERTHSKLITKVIMGSLIKVLSKTDKCFAVNEKMADLYVEYGLKNKPGVLTNATELKLCEDFDKIASLKEKHQIKDEKILIFVGRIDKTKNIHFTVEVLRKLKELKFNYRMLIIGGGPYMKKLVKQIKKYELEEYVILTGRIYEREDIAAYYRMANLMIFPSTYDASSLVQIEAASQKTPTIFAKNSITSSTITPDVNGYEAELDVDIFARKIISVLEDNKKHLEVAQNAYDQIYTHWDKKVEDIYDFYLELIEEKKRS
ncbi:predicted glycosyltransferase [Alteracholeplasma palmae J233]|uniref:Predicted glycosyltransferase n=1 Tax=Alteracholeplasma palmae (strain ATCC 49389 / J233) TaxID=1318466 RepID=U4KLC5_ALTPJ|nr:glycosyltransferase [Alteracholeplasma palmae]CCV64612.1 predicted glycosyltransferase [Alteracholeplasma palmae J233]